MKRGVFTILIIASILLISGCCFYSREHVTRNYTYEPSDNVTIYIYKQAGDTLNIYESNISEIKVIEKVDLPGNSGQGTMLLEDYVRFVKNDSNLSMYIRMVRPSDGGLIGINDARADVEVYLPTNTSYNVNYVEPAKIKWPE